MSLLKFGTDGWRSVIADGYTYENLGRISQATANYLKKSTKSKLVVIGYDNRFLSEEFALEASRVMTANGFRVELSDQSLTSPTLSFQVKSKKAGIGIMITASHNPASFSGFKLKGHHGGSVSDQVTKSVEEEIDALDTLRGEEKAKRTDFYGSYIKWLKKLVPGLSLSKIKGPIIFDSMHGPAAKILEEIYGKKSPIIFLRSERDPLFGGVNPEPIESNLQLLKESVIRKKAAVGIAVDGDGDRIGLVDDKGTYIPPHTVMPLLLEHLIDKRKLKGKVVQTVSMGYLPSRVAQRYKLDFDQVPVGFKYIAEKMSQEKVLFGGEESGGYGIGAWSPERDGLLCTLLILEILSKNKKPLSKIIEELMSNYGQSHFKRVDFQLKETVKKEEWITNICSHIGSKIGTYVVKDIIKTDGIKIILEDDSWVLLRPSGTEPLIRTYSESPTLKVVKDLLTEAEKLVHMPPPRPQRGRTKADPKNKGSKQKILSR